MLTNLDYLVELSGGDNDFIKDIVRTFIEETPENLARINEALERKDYSTIKNLAHKIKPSITFFGIKELELEIPSLEYNIQNQVNVDKIPEQVKCLNKLLNEALLELKVHL